jgi:hypothetical protein
MTRNGDPKRTALVLVLDHLGALDKHFAELDTELDGEHRRVFRENPRYVPDDVVLLGAFGRRGSGDLYVFAGVLTGCKYRRAEKTLTFQHVKRFGCPVVAAYGDVVLRDDLLGDRQLWGPHEFNYVLPAALTKVPEEAEALLRRDPRGDDPRVR